MSNRFSRRASLLARAAAFALAPVCLLSCLALAAVPALADAGGTGGAVSPNAGGPGGGGSATVTGTSGTAGTVSSGGGGGGAGATGGAGGNGGGGAGSGSGGISGTNGGAGVAGGASTGGGGGGGAHGAVDTVSTTLSAASAGGAGGAGGSAVAGNGGGGGGGEGGYGVVMSGTGLSLDTSASGFSVTGGAGGAGGQGTGTGGGGAGGDGGIGILVTGTSGTLTIQAGSTVSGGHGGAGGSGAVAGAGGAGGIGIEGQGLTINDTGAIVGGLSGNGTTRADAIDLTGGSNMLTLNSGFSITGNIGVDGLGTTLTINQTGSTTLASAITGTGALIDNGSGTLILTGANTITGGTTINGSATLQIGNGGAAGSLAGNIADNGALVFDLSGSQTVTGAISGSGTLAQQGAGVLTLTNGSNSFAGGTSVSFGTLAITSDGALGAPGGGVALSNGGTLQFDSSVLSARTIALGTAGGTINTLGNTDTLTGVISGSTGLTVAGASGGALVLLQTETYGGGTTINSGGTLQLGNGGTAGSITGNVIDNGTFAFDRSDPVTFSGAISGTGGLSLLSGGTLVLTGANSYQGVTTINGGTLQVGNGGSVGSLGTGNVNDNGTLAFDVTPGPTTYAGTISGSGSLHDMAGTLILTGNSTYAGGTTIDPGATLQIGNGGATGAIGGAILDNGALVTDLTGPLTLSGQITGSGTLTQEGTGVLTITANNSYGGGTTITAGLINFNSASNFGTGQITLNGGGVQWASHTSTDISTQLAPLGVNGGSFDTDGNNVTLSSGISGSGGLTKLGNGVLTLVAANTYVGGTIVDAGLIDFSSASNFGSGKITGNGGGLQWAASTTTDISSDLNPIGANGILFDTNGNNVTLASPLSGSGGVTKLGAGILTLSGVETYTGATVVSAGTLNVTGSIPAATSGTPNSSVTVDSGATLEGTGTIPALKALGGSTIIPGTGASGSLFVQDGTATSSVAGTLVINLTSAGSNALTITGASGLGGKLSLNPTGSGFTLGENFTVLSASGGLTGAFGSLSTNGSFGSVHAVNGNVQLVPEVTYSTDNATVTLDASQISPFLPNSAGQNEKNVAAAIDFAMANDNAIPTFAPLALDSPAQLEGALASLSGEVAASAQTTEVNTMTSFMDVLGNAPTIGGSNGSAELANRYDYVQVADNGPIGGMFAGPEPNRGGFDLWGAAHGTYDNADANAALGTHPSNGTDIGATLGFGLRARSGHALIGLALGYDDLSWHLAQSLGHGHATALQGGLYASLLFGETYVGATGSFGTYDVNTNRTVSFSGPNSYAAKFTASDSAAHLEFGQRFGGGLGWFMPYIDGSIEELHTPAYSETTTSGSSSFALSFGKQAHTDVTAEVGAEYDANFGDPRQDPTILHARLGWLHDFAAGISDTATFEGFAGATFTVRGSPPSKDAAHALVGIEQDYGSLALTFNANGLVGTSSKGIGGDAGIAYRW